MQEKIKEVEKYFRIKLVSGDYEVKEVNEFRCKLLIDGKYLFYMWIANGQASYNISNILDPSYMYFNLTSKESEKGWSSIKPHLDENYKNVTLQKKLKDFEALKKELNIK